MTLGPSILEAMDLHHLPQLGSHTLVMTDYMFWTLRERFLASIQSILRLREGGLATAGPPCGSFVYLNLGIYILTIKNEAVRGALGLCKKGQSAPCLGFWAPCDRIVLESLANLGKLMIHYIFYCGYYCQRRVLQPCFQQVPY